ncbi:MAG TPA: 50S ribosomal protein L35 [Isosphaeraceae bacterium]|nr:50S ribosomal protein L35 [Isosphaeraceae bacterium]
MASQKMKTHKGTKKRFKVSATGKVGHKPCGSSHLNSHKSGKKIRRLRKKQYLKVGAEARRLRVVLRSEPKFEAPAETIGVEAEPTTEPASA